MRNNFLLDKAKPRTVRLGLEREDFPVGRETELCGRGTLCEDEPLSPSLSVAAACCAHEGSSCLSMDSSECGSGPGPHRLTAWQQQGWDVPVILPWRPG